MRAASVVVLVVLALYSTAAAQEEKARWWIRLASDWTYPADTLLEIRSGFLVGAFHSQEQWLPLDSIVTIHRNGIWNPNMRYAVFGLAGAAVSAFIPQIKKEDGTYLFPDEDGRMMVSIVFPIIGAAAGILCAKLVTEEANIDLSDYTILETRAKLEELIKNQNAERGNGFDR